MAPLYDRMASEIADNPSPIATNLATAILHCTTCSLRVLTVAELTQALDEDTSGMLDLEKSIVDLCGGFVVIDNGGNVAMIHQTAREYLLSSDSPNRPFQIDRQAAHKQMFLSCMHCLMAPGLRGRVNRNQAPEFLDYASTSWSTHLALASVDSNEVLKVLKRFLTGQWILTWVQVLASSKQLRVLVQASKHLSYYAHKQRQEAIMDSELIESWSVDLVKILGKFGTILRRNPEYIYKLISPFCPHSSAIYQLFGKAEKNLVISGQTNGSWDDSVARISLSFGTFASSISAAGAQVAILASSGNISLFDSAVFEESTISPIKHGERVYRFQLNGSATLLATYGYRTIKIWETATGDCKLSIPNIESKPRPLAMLFTNNSSTLLVGSDDRRIRSLDLTSSYPEWELVAELEEPELEGHFLNSSNHMALSKDGSMIAVAYRGHPLSAWEIDGPVHIGHCWRNREEVARGEVIEGMWHPHSRIVLGLYIEGTVFKWDVYGGAPDELATGASRLAMSMDGNLFATGDVRGRVKIYATADFSPLYQLSAEDNVLSLAFSPDLRRFYDLRGSYANVWEPNALLRFADETGTHEGGSDTFSLTQGSTESINGPQRVDSITVLAASPVGLLYCYGTEKGRVYLQDTKEGKTIEIYSSKSYLSIEKMSWSGDGRYICFSDSTKKIIIVSIIGEPNKEQRVKMKAMIPMKNIAEGPIQQVLFHLDSSQFLVCASSTIHTVLLESCSVTKSLKLNTAARKWITHPQDQDLLIGLGLDGACLLDWHLAEQQTYYFDYALSPVAPAGVPTAYDTLDRVLVTHDKKHLLLQISLLSRRSKEKDFLYVPVSAFAAPKGAVKNAEQQGEPIVTSVRNLPAEIVSQIALAISFLPQDRLVFLSKTFSITSWKVSSTHAVPSLLPSAKSDTSITPGSTALPSHPPLAKGPPEGLTKELFSLPGDWISRDCLDLCTVWGKERSLLCPRNGEVAVVRCAGLA